MPKKVDLPPAKKSGAKPAASKSVKKPVASKSLKRPVVAKSTKAVKAGERNVAAASGILTKAIPADIATGSSEVVETSGAELHNRLVIVGIGASAGGLEALKELISGLGYSETLTYVVAQHLSPSHSSLLRELLRPSTELSVRDVTDRLVPQANTVYITPPNHDVEFSNGMLRLVRPKASVGPKPSVDHFFTSLAENYGEYTVGIILSGTGSDGALGVRAIKAAGGVALIQDPQTAKYDGMPRAAIQTGSADMVLPAQKIGEVLLSLITQPASMRLPLLEDEITGAHAKINTQVKRHTGFDLSHYKSATVSRRMSRRMALHKLPSLDAYAELIRSNRDEAKQLAKDVLISVTSFFRDPQAFDLLRVQLEKTLDEVGRESVVRVWVAACATGEEAYGIAILLSEIIREKGLRSDFLIFATDLDTDALAFGRAGNYPDTAVEALPKPIRDRYFEQTGRTYQVKKSLRQSMVFAVQNVIEDPPFSRVDLISCRNLLIYFNRDVQRRVLEIFHYALRAGGRLFLGKSESIELHKDLFADLDKRARIFLRRDAQTSTYAAVPMRSRRNPKDTEDVPRRGPEFPNVNYRLLTALSERYCPPCVVINDNDEPLHFVGELRPFLHFPRGSAEHKVFDMVPDEWRGEIRALVHRCRRERQVQTGTVLSVTVGESLRSFVAVVTPLPIDKQTMLALSFEPAEKPLHAATEASGKRDDRDSVIIEELEKELASTRQHLQTVVEELETSNEELMSQSEELQSANEELQSTNEELQTSNEELQSTNEELLTVNDELQSKSQELAGLAADLQNMKESLDFPMLVTDDRMHLRYFNRSADKVLPKEGLQIDISLASIDWHIDMVGLLSHIKTVIRSGKPVETTVKDDQGRIFTVRIMPTSAPESETHGSVITFIDNSERAAAEQDLREREGQYRVSFEASVMGLALLKRNLQFVRVNPAICTLLQKSESELLKMSLIEAMHDPGNREWRMAIDELVHAERKSMSELVNLKRADGSVLKVLLSAGLVGGEGPIPAAQGISVQLIDVSKAIKG